MIYTSIIHETGFTTLVDAMKDNIKRTDYMQELVHFKLDFIKDIEPNARGVVDFNSK